MPIISPTAISPHRIGGARNWSSYWTTHIPHESDLASRLVRSGTSLVDSVGDNDATILLPVAKFNGTNNIITMTGKYVTGGQPWDVYVKFKVTNSTARRPILQCGGWSGTAPGLLFYILNGDIVVSSANGSAQTNVTLDFDIQDNTWYTLRLQWSGIEGETLSITVGATTKTTTSVRGWTGNSNQNLKFGGYLTYWHLGSLASVVGTIGGSTFKLYPHGLSSHDWSIEETTRCVLATWAGDADHYEYSADGDPYYLDSGYLIKQSTATLVKQYIPNNSTGIQIGAVLDANYKDIQIAEGSTTGHNLFPSKIRFANDFFDRSNTIIWGDSAREGYYDSDNPKDFHIDELEYKTLRSWLNVGYKGMIYLKFSENSIEFRERMDEILLYTTDKTNEDQRNCLVYSGDLTQALVDAGGNCTLDANDYVEIYDYSALGAEADAIANFNTIQAGINAGDYTIGKHKYEVKKISQPIVVPEGRTLTVNCELKIKNATTVDISSNVTAGDTVINVASVDGFHAGEWVCLSDDDQTLQGGSTGQTRRRAHAAIISEVGESTITIDRACIYNLATASNAKLGHNQSVILLDNKNNVTINGTGVINGNWQNQYDVEPYNASGEEVRAYCGISIFESNGCNVKGTETNHLTFRNAGMHSVAIRGNTAKTKGNNNTVQYVTSWKAHDKGVLAYYTDGTIIRNYVGKYSIFEDGITIYQHNTNYTIEDVNVIMNNRTGIALSGAENSGTSVVNRINALSDNILISSFGLTATDLTLRGDYAIMYISSSGAALSGLTLNNLTFDMCSGGNTYILKIVGNVSNIAINEMEINGCVATNGIEADDYSSDGNFPQNVTITGGGIYNGAITNKTVIDASADVTITDFDGLV